MMTLSLRATALALVAAAGLGLAADTSSDHHVSKTESGLARALSGFLNALNDDLERQQRDREPRDSHDDVTIEIQGDHGWVPIHLQRRGSGFVGPRGEYYSSLPERSELEQTYGRAPSQYSGMAGHTATGASHAERSGVSVERGDGEVTVYQPNHSPLRIRTEGSLVKEWRVNDDGSVSVLSHSPGTESVVQNFSLRDGRQRDRVWVRDIRDGRPAWAVPFQHAGSNASSGARGGEWAGTSARRGPGEVTVEVPGRAPLRIRTEGSVVKEWRVNETDGSISVLSLVPGNDPVVQNFSLRDGRQRDRVLARDVRNGRPAWAAGFESAGYQRVTNPMVTLRVDQPPREGKTKGPRVTVAGNSIEGSVRVWIWDDRNNRVTERDVPTQNGYWNTQVPLERGRYRLRAEGQSGRDHEEFWFEVR